MQTMIVCEEIGELLEQLGLARKEKGFERLSYAIAVTAQEFERAGSVTKLLYPDLAKHFQTTPEKIERSLRHLIEKSWEKGEKPGSRNYSVITGIIRRTVRPTVSILQSWLTRSGVAAMRMDWKVLRNLSKHIMKEKQHGRSFVYGLLNRHE